MSKFPFSITQEILDAYHAHCDYVSAGQAWLESNDPEGQHELVLIEEIQTAIRNAAQDYFGDDEDAEYEFYDQFQIDDSYACVLWYDLIEHAAA